MTFVKQGYNDGLSSGLAKQCQEGFKLGLQKGSEIGSEVGYYRGFALVSLKHLKLEGSKSPLSTKQKKCVKVLEKLLTSTEEFPSTNPRHTTSGKHKKDTIPYHKVHCIVNPILYIMYILDICQFF